LRFCSNTVYSVLPFLIFSSFRYGLSAFSLSLSNAGILPLTCHFSLFLGIHPPSLEASCFPLRFSPPFLWHFFFPPNLTGPDSLSLLDRYKTVYVGPFFLPQILAPFLRSLSKWSFFESRDAIFFSDTWQLGRCFSQLWCSFFHSCESCHTIPQIFVFYPERSPSLSSFRTAPVILSFYLNLSGRVFLLCLF